MTVRKKNDGTEIINLVFKGTVLKCVAKYSVVNSIRAGWITWNSVEYLVAKAHLTFFKFQRFTPTAQAHIHMETDIRIESVKNP